MARSTLSRGSSGPDVSHLHQLLGENGFAVGDDAELRSSSFGYETLEIVKHFQSCNVGPDGRTLEPDGVVGSKTWWSLEFCGSEQLAPGLVPSAPLALPDMPAQVASNPVAGAALASAWGEYRLRVKEMPNGSNRGPSVDAYTGVSGPLPSSLGPPWCAYFASWNFAKAPGGSPFGRTGSSVSIVEICQARYPGSVVDVRDPHAFARTVPIVQAGDLGIVQTGPGHGHVFHVAAALDGEVWTVEGNSGNAVRTRKRPISSVRWFVNFDQYARERGF